MSLEKATALVLKAVPWSEASSVVTLFTREFGKVRGVAKGARRPKGPFEGALDLLSICRVVFLRKSSDALDLLTEAKLERRFRPRSKDLSSLYAGYYVAELLGALTDDYDPHSQAFDAAVETLAGLSAAGGTASLVLRFEMLTLGSLGHMPSLSHCVECGAEVEWAGRIAFGLIHGGVLCGKCRAGKTEIVGLSAGAAALLAQYADASNEHYKTLEPSGRLLGEMRGAMNQYIAHLLGRRPAMHAYLKMLAD